MSTLCIAAEPLTDMHTCCQTNDRTPNVLLFQHLHTASHTAHCCSPRQATPVWHKCNYYYYYYYIRLMAFFPGQPGKPAPDRQIILDFTAAGDDGGGSGISWTICKLFAPRSRQITMPAPHHSVFLQAGCPSCHPTNSVKALKAIGTNGKGKLRGQLANTGLPRNSY